MRLQLALHEESSSVSGVLAPEEQHVYSPKFLIYPAPSGAECKPHPSKQMALRWSAQLFTCEGYKHGAPPEHSANANKQKSICVQSRLTIYFGSPVSTNGAQ